MKYQFFSVPSAAPELAQDDIDRFCRSHRVISVEKYFVADAERSHWARRHPAI